MAGYNFFFVNPPLHNGLKLYTKKRKIEGKKHEFSIFLYERKSLNESVDFLTRG